MTTVLLAEDNEMNRDLFARLLGEAGYTVLEAADGSEAVDLAREEEPAAVLMDLSMPVMDGWEATRRLRDAEATTEIPIVAVTAHLGEEERRRAREAGCDVYLTKPFDFEELFETIESLVESRP